MPTAFKYVLDISNIDKVKLLHVGHSENQKLLVKIMAV